MGPSLRGVCQLDGGTLGLQRGRPETAQEPNVKANAINNALRAGQRLVCKTSVTQFLVSLLAVATMRARAPPAAPDA